MSLKFPTGEGNLINYNWSDLATGTGFKTFYCASVIEASTETYYLLPEALQTFTRYTSANNTAIELNFNLPFYLPTRLKGKGYINIPIIAYNTTGNGKAGSFAATLKFYKVVGVAETQIGSTVSATLSYNLAPAVAGVCYWNAFMLCGAIDIPLTLFKPAESLRLEITTAASGNTGVYVMIFHDPKNYGLTAELDAFLNSETTLLSSISLINLPFKIDL